MIGIDLGTTHVRIHVKGRGVVLREPAVIAVENGAQMRRQISRAMTDLVLLDVQLPRLDGWSVLTQLRQRGETPVIMLTALDQDLDKLTALRMGADD